jgi:peptidoglycan/LPS O-acetylase OafA/YrhL
VRTERSFENDIYRSDKPAVACTVLPSRPSLFQLGYRPELDGIRGISILLVFGLHFTPRYVPGGYFGVEIFFVLSGFLITGLLLQEWHRRSSINLRDFYLRRAFRLGPALIVYLILLSGYALIFMTREHATEIYIGVLATLSYVSNWLIAFLPSFPTGILAITWSLAVEEQFYFFWPLTLYLLLSRKLSPRIIILVIAIGLLIVVSHRLFLFHQGASFRRLYYATDTRADGLLWGCLLACLASWDLFPKSRIFEFVLKILAVISGIFLLFLAITMKSSNPILFKGVFTLATLAITIFITAVVLWPNFLGFSILKLRPLVWIGRISYGLYLWHWAVRGYIFGPQSQPSAGRIVVAVILTFVIASLSFYVIEQPFLKLKKKFSHA